MLLLFCFHAYIASAQTVTNDKEMVLMSDSYQNDYKLGSIYYNMGSNTPFTGILYGKYVNGNYQTKQEYVDGVGNGNVKFKGLYLHLKKPIGEWKYFDMKLSLAHIMTYTR